MKPSATIPLNKIVVGCLVLLLTLVSTVPVLSQSLRQNVFEPIPAQMSFQGLMVDTTGTTVSGSHSVMFAIYTDSLGITPVWSETQSVGFEDGLFDVYLGSATPLPDSIFTGETLWLGIKVGADPEMTPRTRIVSTAYSFLSRSTYCLPSVWYFDQDADTYGDPDSTGVACTMPTGFVGNSGDCDDSDFDINPDGTEVCDTLDNDCDGEVDEGFQTIWYYDEDSDTFGTPDSTATSCIQPPSFVENSLDCDDSNFDINPEAEELCDTLDNDCDPGTPDGASEAWLGQACDNGDEDLCANGLFACGGGLQLCFGDSPTPELCGNGLDDDCDSTTDEAECIEP